MKLYLITLTLSLIALFIFIKRTYEYSSVQDTVEPPIDYESTHKVIKKVNIGSRELDKKSKGVVK